MPDQAITFTEEEINHLIQSGKLTLETARLLPDKSNRAMAEIQLLKNKFGDHQIASPGMALAPTAVATAGSAATGLARVPAALSRAARIMGPSVVQGIGTATGHPWLGMAAGHALGRAMPTIPKPKPVPTPQPPSPKSNVTKTRGPMSVRAEVNPSILDEVTERVLGTTNNGRSGVQNDFRGRVSIKPEPRKPNFALREYPKGADRTTSPARFKELADIDANGQVSNAEVEAVRRFISAKLRKPR